MSLIKPEDDDYIVRGLILLLAWLIIGMPGMAFAVAAVFHNGGMAVLGVLAAIPLGIFGYGAYLKFGEREHAKRDAKRLEAMIELRRIELEMLRRGYTWWGAGAGTATSPPGAGTASGPRDIWPSAGSTRSGGWSCG